MHCTWFRLLVHARLLEVAALENGNNQRADVRLEGCVRLVHGDGGHCRVAPGIPLHGPAPALACGQDAGDRMSSDLSQQVVNE
jgi:hypothetical protein